jgi:hypothetical protein
MKVSEVPEDMLIFEALAQKYLKLMPPIQLRAQRIELNHDLDLTRLKSSIDASLEKFGVHRWQSSEGPNNAYYGFSLNYNPDHQDQLDPNGSSLGTPKNSRDQFFYASFDQHKTLKNSYFDSYGFRKRTPAACHGYLNEILESCQRSMIRSRMMIIDGSAYTPELIQAYKQAQVGDSRYGWHRDEPVFVNLRVNIPVVGDDNFVFEMSGGQPYVLRPKYAYSWDTNVPHRVYCRQATQAKRYNLVVGVSPWFDYLPDEDAWVPNQYCGKMSPFEMLRKGLIFPWLKD